MKRTVLVIGGGPAGLTAALRLSSAGYSVTLIEQSDKVGGRLENAPLVFLGYQKATRSLLDSLGTSRLLRSSDRAHFDFHVTPGRYARLRRPWLPGPLHAMLGLVLLRALSLRDRWRALSLIERTWEKDPALPPDLDARNADEWLAQRGQSEQARARVWTPLGRFLLGEDLSVVSAALLVRMLTQCFLSGRRNSALTVPVCSVRALLVDPALDQLKRSGATLRHGNQVNRLQFSQDQIVGVDLLGGDQLKADWYVLAVPRRMACSLLPDRILTHYAYFEQLTKLTESPALAVHLWINQSLATSRLILLAGRTFHWIVHRCAAQSDEHRALVSLETTGLQEILNRPDQEVLESALVDLREGLPDLAEAKVLHYEIIRETHAILSPRPGSASLRPLPRGPISNLLLAGAWTDTGLPATLESAILSGERCAQAIMADQPTT